MRKTARASVVGMLLEFRMEALLKSVIPKDPRLPLDRP
jgi:hypothetical protein